MQSAAVAEDRIFQALADPSRRAIFESLTRGEAAAKHLTARFDISQPAVSPDGRAATVTAYLKGDGDGETITDPIEGWREIVSDPGGGLAVKITGAKPFEG